ncbi:MAG TPA: M28 family peptidase [Blastocatellia bacterium]|nr:M28 family peptidase [Blastocatellia bacterium]
MFKSILPRAGKSSALCPLLFFLLLVTIPAGGAAPGDQKSTPEGAGKPAQFDPRMAYKHAKSIVGLGPRTPGSEASRKAQEYIGAELRGYGLKVSDDRFEARTPRGAMPMTNIIGELPGEKTDVVIISGHYDTKIQPGFVGANDGGSSAATVLEIARGLSKFKPEYTLWFVFFDGEEAVVDWDANGGTDNTYGSRRMASRLVASGTMARVKAMILVDMIGDRSLDLRRDTESTPWLVELIWSAARRAGHGKHFLDEEGAYLDDHLPFKEAGVPVVDLIDFNFGPDNSYWHTNHDTLDKISGESMKVIGDVIIGALPDLFARLNRRAPNIDRGRPKG